MTISKSKKGSGSPSLKLKPLPPRDCLKDRKHKNIISFVPNVFQGVATKNKERIIFMIVRQLKAEKFDYFQNQLIKRAQQNPLEASFNVTVKVDRKEYVLRIQPENKHRVVALQALEVDRDEECGHLHMLITDNKILSSLLELLIWQGVA